MCALTKKNCWKKKKRTDFPELFKRRDGYFLRPPKAMQPVQWKNIELEKTHRILKIEKKKWFDRYFFKHCRGSWRGEKRFRWGLCTGTFCCRLGGSWENWGGPCSFLHLLLLPLFYFFFFKTIFCAVLVVVVVVCALNLIQRAGTGDENFSIQNLGAREGGGLNGLNWNEWKKISIDFFFVCSLAVI